MLELRDATAEDAEGIARVNAAAWRAAYRGMVEDATLAGLPVGQWTREIRENIEGLADDSFSWVATEGEGVVGSCYVAAPGRDEPAGSAVAELAAIYVDPDRWRQGIGGMLLSEAIREAQGRGYREMKLRTFERNAAAQSFYRRHGFEADGGTGRFMPGDIPTISMRRPLG